jgi:DNA primase
VPGDFDTIKERVDIVALISEKVALKKAGTVYKGLCPFHSEKTPSFTVDPERRTYHCF